MSPFLKIEESSREISVEWKAPGISKHVQNVPSLSQAHPLRFVHSDRQGARRLMVSPTTPCAPRFDEGMI